MGIRTAILCDQVRQEDNGKLLLIGVYTGGIILQTFPAVLHLTAFLLMDGPAVHDQKFGVRVLVGGIEAGTFEGGFTKPSSGDGWIPVALPPIAFPGPTDLRIEAKDGPDGPWGEIYRIAVQKAAEIASHAT